MNRSPMPPRKKPMPPPTSGLRRTSALQQQAGRESLDARKSAPKKVRVELGPTADVVDAVVERERHSCLICGYGVGPYERGRRWSLHHRLRRAQGVEHTVQNLVLLCGGSVIHGCHQVVHANPDASRDGGWLLKGRQHPLAIPVLIPLEGRRVYLGSTGLYHLVREQAS